MKYIVIILILLIIGCTEGSLAMSQPGFDQRTYPYYWNTEDNVQVHFLVLGQKYGVLIGANQPSSEQQWINFTAINNNANIHFRQQSAYYTNQSEKLTELYINLYQLTNNSQSNPLYIDQLILPVIYASQQANTEALVANGVQFFIIIGLTFMGCFGFIIAWRRIRR